MFSLRMIIDIAFPSFNVKEIIANLAALSSKKFMWNFRSSMNHDPPVVSSWQHVSQSFNDTSELIIGTD